MFGKKRAHRAFCGLSPRKGGRNDDLSDAPKPPGPPPRLCTGDERVVVVVVNDKRVAGR